MGKNGKKGKKEKREEKHGRASPTPIKKKKNDGQARTYSDGHPHDEVQYLEAKLILGNKAARGRRVPSSCALLRGPSCVGTISGPPD